MILSCERCSARYAIDVAQLGGSGRKVRCNSCGHTWFQTPEAEASAPDGLIAPEFQVAAAPEPTPAPNPVAAPPADDPSRSLRRFGATAARKAAPPRNPAPRKRAIGIAARLLPAAAVIAATIGLRSELVDIWPPAARFFAAMGLPAPETAPGLAIRAVHMEEQTSDGHRTIIVQGELANTGAEAHKVPTLHASLGQGDETVARWSFAAGPVELAPGQVAQFRTQLVNAPEGARTVSVGLWR